VSTYRGVRVAKGALEVTADGQLLPPRFDLANHSPSGFECGYAGSGPAQLALAILAHALGDDRTALIEYPGFKRDIIARLAAPFELTSSEVEDWLSGQGLDEALARMHGS